MAAQRSARIRWPSESERTGELMNASSSSMRRNSARLASKRAGGDAIDVAQQVERVDHGQVPPERGALAEDRADGGDVADAVAPGDKAVDFDLAVGGDEQAGEHLDRGGFARAVGTEIADQFARGHVEADVIDGADFGLRAAHEAAQTGPATLQPPIDIKRLAEMTHADHGRFVHGHTPGTMSRCFCSDGRQSARRPAPRPGRLIRPAARQSASKRATQAGRVGPESRAPDSS